MSEEWKVDKLNNPSLLRLIHENEEHENLDYKETFDPGSRRCIVEIAKDFLAFSNTIGGGLLVIGVDDSKKIVGLPFELEIKWSNLSQALERYCSPRIKFKHREFRITYQRKPYRIIVVEVLEHERIVMAKNAGNYETTRGKSTSIFDPGDILIRKHERSERCDADDVAALLRRKGPAAETEKQTYSVINNLPKPDYSRLFGREKEIKQIIDLLNGRNFLISIDGIGGVGKSALALEIAWLCVKQPMFNSVIWISAKRDRLSILGIEQVVSALSSYDDLLNTILETCDFPEYLYSPTEEKEEQVKNLLTTAPFLIIIDNLETVTDERIIEFLKDLPEPSKGMTTTRKRLGEVERVVRISQLDENATCELIRSEAQERGAKILLDASDEVIKEVWQRTGGIPLAIKWIVGLVATGRPLESFISDSRLTEAKDLLNFCFREAYSSFTPEAKIVFKTFPLFSEPPTLKAIAEITNMSMDITSQAIAQLLGYSLIFEASIKKSGGEIVTGYSMLPLTEEYAMKELDTDRKLSLQATERLAAYQKKEERVEQALRQYGIRLEDIGATTPQGRLAALQAQTAFAAYQQGHYDEASRLFQEAQKTNPRLSFVFQLWALVEFQEGHNSWAEELYRKAVHLNPRHPVIWQQWANMKHALGDNKGMLEVLKESIKHNSGNERLIHQYAVALSLNGEFEKAESYYAELERKANSGRGRNFKLGDVVRRARIENLRKWGQYLLDAGKHNEAKEKLTLALTECNRGMQSNNSDSRLYDAKRSLEIILQQFP